MGLADLARAITDGRGPAGWLVLGDCLALLNDLPAESVDLIIADPPFGSGRRHHAREAQFDDRWGGISDYLSFLTPRLTGMHRVLRPTGSLVLHADHHAVHHARLALEQVFGARHFVNEIIWHYTGGGRSRRRFSHKHDTLLWFAKGPDWTFNVDAARVPYQATSGFARSGIVARSGKRYLPHPQGTPVDDVWDIPIINPLSPERRGFPTQKPERLIERLIAILSVPDQLLLDPFCGSGTTPLVASRLARRWIAADISPAALAITEQRLRSSGVDAYLRTELPPPR